MGGGAYDALSLISVVVPLRFGSLWAGAGRRLLRLSPGGAVARLLASSPSSFFLLILDLLLLGRPRLRGLLHLFVNELGEEQSVFHGFLDLCNLLDDRPLHNRRGDGVFAQELGFRLCAPLQRGEGPGILPRLLPPSPSSPGLLYRRRVGWEAVV